MTNSTRVVRHGIALAFGVIIAALLASIVGAFSRRAAIVLFVTLVFAWIACSISFASRQLKARGGRLGAFADPQHWSPERLPLEFRFITHDTPIDQVLDKIGPPSSRPPIPRGAVRYDWPDGRIMFVHTEFPASRTGRVSAIQIYDEASDIPIDEII